MSADKQRFKATLPLYILFLIVNAVLWVLPVRLAALGLSVTVVMAGNALLFLVSLASLFLYQRAMLHPATIGFLKNTYSGLFLKLLVCLFAVVTYIGIGKRQVNKPAILTCVALYFIYSLLEMRGLLQWNKSRNNA
jgi:hypothetical protein